MATMKKKIQIAGLIADLTGTVVEEVEYEEDQPTTKTNNRRAANTRPDIFLSLKIKRVNGKDKVIVVGVFIPS
jgi:hypothetical protein